MKSPVIKRSIDLDGHKTSVCLEDAFWNALKEIAHERGESLRYLIASIDGDRKFANLPSAIRLFVLEFYKEQFARQDVIEEREIPVQQAKRRKRRRPG
jgi:predicted DNA-binding ribbon-helix-helix protein